MAYREVLVTEIREVLRAWLSGRGLRKVAEQAGVDRKTGRRYVDAAVTAGLVRAESSFADLRVKASAADHGSGWITWEPYEGADIVRTDPVVSLAPYRHFPVGEGIVPESGPRPVEGDCWPSR